MNNQVWIYTEEIKHNKIIKKFYELKIEIIKVKHERERTLYLINEADYQKLKKYCVYKFYVTEIAGIKKIKEMLKNRKIYIYAVVFGIICVFLLSRLIVEVEVIHSKEEIRDLVREELQELGIKRLSIKKNFEELTQIKEKILENNKEKIEWLEIDTKGMKYIIRVEERLILKENELDNHCNIIAKKDGHVLNVSIKDGVANIKNGSYVRKNDVLISGDIILNEEIVDTVCASGNVEAEVWYTINVEMPLYYEEITKTGKTRINFMIEHENKESILLKSRLKDKEVYNKKLLGLLGYNLYIQKEEEIKKTIHKYTEKEVINEAIKIGLKKLNVTLDEEAEIISQKVLKKTINDSKMYLELFVVVKENIGVVQKIN